MYSAKFVGACAWRSVRVSGEQKDDERKIWGDQRGLNPRHSESQSDALPTELWPPQRSKRPCSYIELSCQNQEPKIN